jgi:hypothetical protein
MSEYQIGRALILGESAKENNPLTSSNGDE